MKKSMLIKRISTLIPLLTFFFITLACSSNTSDDYNCIQEASNDINCGALSDEHVLRRTETDEIRSMDTSFATDSISHGATNRVFSGLITYEDDELTPELAEDMPEANEDNTEYTFKLRDD